MPPAGVRANIGVVAAARAQLCSLGITTLSAMSKHRRQRGPSTMAVGVAWFDREQWRQLCEVAVDRAKLDDTFEE